MPQGVCSALREPGERPGGEVNIVRRGGASPAGLLPSRGGARPAQPLRDAGESQEQSTELGWAQGLQTSLQIVVGD